MKYTRLFVLLGLLIVLMVVSLDCTSKAEPMETEADFIGFITEIHANGEGDILGQISVESHADKIVNRYMSSVKTSWKRHGTLTST
jgi:hypothetical protein